MLVFRLAKEQYSKKLNSSGVANRWNKEGQFVLYTGSSRAITTLEHLVHLSGVIPSVSYKMMIIELKESQDLIKEIKLSELGRDWRTLSEYHKQQMIGSEWYDKGEKLILKIPSAVMPQKHNYVLNTSHGDFKTKVKLMTVEEYFWDERLFINK